MVKAARRYIYPSAVGCSMYLQEGISTVRYVYQSRPIQYTKLSSFTDKTPIIKGGPYENFAGRDATRGLACQSFDEEMLTKDLKGPLDDLSGLNEEELENLNGWEERFSEKYLVVGKLVAEGDPEAP